MAQRCRERAPSTTSKAPLTYSIISSARACIAGGTARPSALAVLRLITSSYLVEDAVNIIWCLAKLLGKIGAISDQAACFRKIAIVINRWDAVAGRERNDRFTICRAECGRHHDEATTRTACLCGDNAFDVIQ